MRTVPSGELLLEGIEPQLEHRFGGPDMLRFVGRRSIRSSVLPGKSKWRMVSQSLQSTRP